MGTNVLTLPPGASGLPEEWNSRNFTIGLSYTERRAQILNNIKELRAQTNLAETPEQKTVFETAIKMEMCALEKLNDEEKAEQTPKATKVATEFETAADVSGTEVRVEV